MRSQRQQIGKTIDDFKGLAMKRLLTAAILCISMGQATADIVIDENATVKDSPTTLLGVNHIGLSVKDLDSALSFYQGVSGFPLIRRETVKESSDADTLFGLKGIEYEIAVLEAPNMLFELIEFSHNQNKITTKMSSWGPGMTHTCFQTPMTLSGYDRFKAAGAEILSYGDTAVDLGGYGVTYAYAYDHEGNMFELEQLDGGSLADSAYSDSWKDAGHTMWMTQVALVTHDIDRLTAYYEKIMAFAPYRKGDYVEHPRMKEIMDLDSLSLRASWFRMNDRSKTLEFWEFREPHTQEYIGKRDVTEFGYSYSIEVGDIHAEYKRMAELGVEFISEPVLIGDIWQVYANDIDGNVFSLRQFTDPNSPYSVPQLEL